MTYILLRLLTVNVEHHFPVWGPDTLVETEPYFPPTAEGMVVPLRWREEWSAHGCVPATRPDRVNNKTCTGKLYYNQEWGQLWLLIGSKWLHCNHGLSEVCFQNRKSWKYKTLNLEICCLQNVEPQAMCPFSSYMSNNHWIVIDIS